MRLTNGMSPAAAGAGALLWAGATALLLEDSWRSGHLTVSHAMVPVLTAGTVAAAALFHAALRELRLASAAGLLCLALLGSTATVYGTLGRQAEGRGEKVASAEAANSAVAARRAALAEAHSLYREANDRVARECGGGFGPRCAGWRETARERASDAERIERELAGMRGAAADPRVDAAVELAVLFTGVEGDWVRARIAALDPLMLPLFLELGSVVFFGAAFPRRRKREIVSQAPATVGRPSAFPVGRDEALRDLLTLIRDGTVLDQKSLAIRWGQSRSTVSRWMSTWERNGLVRRSRDGRRKRPTVPSSSAR